MDNFERKTFIGFCIFLVVAMILVQAVENGYGAGASLLFWAVIGFVIGWLVSIAVPRRDET